MYFILHVKVNFNLFDDDSNLCCNIKNIAQAVPIVAIIISDAITIHRITSLINLQTAICKTPICNLLIASYSPSLNIYIIMNSLYSNINCISSQQAAVIDCLVTTCVTCHLTFHDTVISADLYTELQFQRKLPLAPHE